MAQKVKVTYVCDYDGKLIEEEADHFSREFEVDGKAFEIDLCARHSTMFDNQFGKWIGKARTVRHLRAVNGKPRRTSAHRQNSADIRTWARERGIKIAERGRIPTEVIDQYNARGTATQVAAAN